MFLFDQVSKTHPSQCDRRSRHPAPVRPARIPGAVIAAIFAASAALLTGCGTTPPPEPEGERIPVNFPDISIRHDVDVPITRPNELNNRVTVEGPVIESSLDVMLKASDAAARAPQQTQEAQQPQETPAAPAPVANSSSSGTKVLPVVPAAESMQSAPPASQEDMGTKGDGKAGEDSAATRSFRFESDAPASAAAGGAE